MLLLIITIYSLNVLSTDKIDAKSAKNFIGEIKTVCGRVVSTSYRKSTPGRPIFLNWQGYVSKIQLEKCFDGKIFYRFGIRWPTLRDRIKRVNLKFDSST